MQVTEVRERLKARAQMGSEEQQVQFQLNIAYIYAATSAVLCIGLVNGMDPVWLHFSSTSEWSLQTLDGCWGCYRPSPVGWWREVADSTVWHLCCCFWS